MKFWLLRGKITEKFGTSLNFAEALGVDKNTVSNKLNENTQFSRNEIVVWCQMLDIKKEDIHKYFFSDLS